MSGEEVKMSLCGNIERILKEGDPNETMLFGSMLLQSPSLFTEISEEFSQLSKSERLFISSKLPGLARMLNGDLVNFEE